MKALLIAIFFFAGPVHAALPHTVSVKVWHKKISYSETMVVREGEQNSFSGRVDSSDDQGRQFLIFNATLSERDRLGLMDLMYQVELSPGPGRSGPHIQAQGVIAVKTGSRVVAVLCGDWAVRFTLDKKWRKRKGKKGRKNDFGLPNYSVTMDLTKGKEKIHCKNVQTVGTQINVVDGRRSGNRKSGFSLGAILKETDEGHEIEYQCSYTKFRSKKGLNFSNEHPVTLGKRISHQVQSYKMTLLVEGP